MLVSVSGCSGPSRRVIAASASLLMALRALEIAAGPEGEREVVHARQRVKGCSGPSRRVRVASARS